jgi:hypothetical protein
MSRILGCALAGALALTASVAAQNPPSTPPAQQPPATRTPATQDKADRATASVTVEGCLLREADVPGRTPNVAERAGIGEDFILTQTKMIKGTAPSRTASTTKPGEAVGTSGTKPASMMFEVEGISGDDLKKHAGHRVQIDGMFGDLDAANAAGSDDLVDIRGVAIRQVAGECPAGK